MATQANIVVPDAATTPVNHTFLPHSVKNDVARWNDKLAIQPVGWQPLVVTSRDPVNGSDMFRHSLDVSFPILSTYTSASGAPVTVVDRVSRYQLSVLLPVTGLLQERKDAHKLFSGILNDAQIVDILVNLNRAT
jgi:hypothetical protein